MGCVAAVQRVDTLVSAQATSNVVAQGLQGRAVSSVVERLVYTEDVGSSTLSPPTIFLKFFVFHLTVDFQLPGEFVRVPKQFVALLPNLGV